MATTPFSTTAVTFPGQGLPRDHSYTNALRPFWLGLPGGMVQLPSPSLGYEVSATQGESVTTLMGGRTAVRYQAEEIRSWALKFPKLYGRDFEIVHGFYRRLFGNGPWCYPAPEDTNRLTAAQSLCGNLNDVAEGWTPTAGTVAYDSTLVPAVLPSGVLRWASATNGSRLVAGNAVAGLATADPKTSIPYISALPATGAVWAWTASGTVSARVRLSGVAADGSTVVTTINGSTVTLTTTPQQIFATAAANAFTTAWWLFVDLQCLSASAPNILMSNALVDYRSNVPDWTIGRGVPRVVWPAGPSDSVSSMFSRDVAMTLAQS